MFLLCQFGGLVLNLFSFFHRPGASWWTSDSILHEENELQCYVEFA